MAMILGFIAVQVVQCPQSSKSIKESLLLRSNNTANHRSSKYYANPSPHHRMASPKNSEVTLMDCSDVNYRCCGWSGLVWSAIFFVFGRRIFMFRNVRKIFHLCMTFCTTSLQLIWLFCPAAVIYFFFIFWCCCCTAPYTQIFIGLSSNLSRNLVTSDHRQVYHRNSYSFSLYDRLLSIRSQPANHSIHSTASESNNKLFAK